MPRAVGRLTARDVHAPFPGAAPSSKVLWAIMLNRKPSRSDPLVLAVLLIVVKRDSFSGKAQGRTFSRNVSAIVAA